MDDNRKWTRVALRIFSEEISSREIEAMLGIRGTRRHEKGDIRSSHHCEMWNEAFWSLQSPLSDDRAFSEQVTSLLDALDPRIEVIRVLSEKCRIDLFCGFSSGSGQGGFSLDVALLERLCKFGVPLVLDLYPPNNENDDE